MLATDCITGFVFVDTVGYIWLRDPQYQVPDIISIRSFVLANVSLVVRPEMFVFLPKSTVDGCIPAYIRRTLRIPLPVRPLVSLPIAVVHLEYLRLYTCLYRCVRGKSAVELRQRPAVGNWNVITKPNFERRTLGKLDSSPGNLDD